MKQIEILKCFSKPCIITRNQNFNKNHRWIGDVLTKKELIDLYLKQKLSINSIAKLKEVSANVIYRRLKKYNIAKRDYYEQIKIDQEKGLYKKRAEKFIILKSKSRNRKDYLKIAKSNYKWKCIKCGKKRTNKDFDLIVHHINRNNKDNIIENIQILCQSCHSKLHISNILIKKEKICVYCKHKFMCYPSQKYCSIKCRNLNYKQTK